MLALPLYVAVVVWLTWPLAAHVDTALPHTWEGCHFDLLQMVCALAHQSRALVTAPWARVARDGEDLLFEITSSPAG